MILKFKIQGSKVQDIILIMMYDDDNMMILITWLDEIFIFFLRNNTMDTH